MLQHLVAYANRHFPEVKLGFAEKRVRWAVLLNSSNYSFEVLDLANGEKSKRGMVFADAPDLEHSELVSGGARKEGRCHFLIEAAEVVALLPKKGSKPKDLKHGYFKRVLRQAATEARMPDLEVIADFLDSSFDEFSAELLNKKVKPENNMTFAVDGKYPVESDKWHRWWKDFREVIVQANEKKKKKNGVEKQLVPCLVTGELIDKPVRIHQKLSGLSSVGGNARCSLISYDKEAFRSYGSEQGFNVPISEGASSSAMKALNYLIANSSYTLSESRVVYWFDRDINPEFDVVGWINEPPKNEEGDALKEAKKLLHSINSGELPDLADANFFIVNLSGVQGRVMLRDWMEGPFSELLENTLGWFDDLSMVSPFGDRLRFPPRFNSLLKTFLSKGDNKKEWRKKISSSLSAQLFNAAIKGVPLPRNAISTIYYRVRSKIVRNDDLEMQNLPECMALIKAWHIRNSLEGGEYMKPYLNEEHPDPAYQCGRLLAVLADLQRSAMPNINVGVVQSFFASASSTPALVIGRLICKSQVYLAKLNRPLAYWYEGRIGDVMSRIGDSIPTVLITEGQTSFALGFYQQMVFDRNSRKNGKEKKDKREVE